MTLWHHDNKMISNTCLMVCTIAKHQTGCLPLPHCHTVSLIGWKDMQRDRNHRKTLESPYPTLMTAPLWIFFCGTVCWTMLNHRCIKGRWEAPSVSHIKTTKSSLHQRGPCAWWPAAGPDHTAWNRGYCLALAGQHSVGCLLSTGLDEYKWSTTCLTLLHYCPVGVSKFQWGKYRHRTVINSTTLHACAKDRPTCIYGGIYNTVTHKAV